MVFVNGMGLRVVEEQKRQQIQKAADKGVLVYTTMATNPANNICTIDSVDESLCGVIWEAVEDGITRIC